MFKSTLKITCREPRAPISLFKQLCWVTLVTLAITISLIVFSSLFYAVTAQIAYAIYIFTFMWRVRP
jgi:hypothetical protein